MQSEAVLEVVLGFQIDLGYKMIHGKIINKLWENLEL
jgi:hypothetical protein